MKRKAVVIIGSILIISIAFITFWILIIKGQFKVPTIENISSIKVVPAKVGASKRDEFSFDLSNKEQLNMVNNILYWLKSGQIIGNSKGDMIYHGGSPTYLVIELKDGSKIQIQSAVDAITTKVPYGTEVKGQSVSGQVTLYFSDSRKPIRELAPELKSFIDDEKYYKPESKDDTIIYNLKGNVNTDRLTKFVDNVDKDIKDRVNIVRYTTEGDPIITQLYFDGKDIQVSTDNSKDKYGGQDKNKIIYNTIKGGNEIKNNLLSYLNDNHLLPYIYK